MDIKRLKKLLLEATPLPHKIMRYEHGGGRVWVGEESGKRNLIADFYEEADRECFIAARENLCQLIESNEKISRALEEIENRADEGVTRMVQFKLEKSVSSELFKHIREKARQAREGG